MATTEASSIQNPIPSGSGSVNIQAETESKTYKRADTSSIETKGRNFEETDGNPKVDIMTEVSSDRVQNPNEDETSSMETKGRNPEETEENPMVDNMTEGSYDRDTNPNEGKGDTFTEGSHEIDQNPNEEQWSIKAEGSHKTYQNSNEGEQGEEEEEGECGFCLFMKGGGCKDQFIAWEKCVEEGEVDKEDIAEKCYKVTSLLRECMDLHSDYYEPLFRAEKAMDEKIVEEMNEQESQEDAQVEERESHDK